MGDPKDGYRSSSFTLVKWILVVFSILNILSSVWVGIAMEKAVDQVLNKTPDVDPNFQEGDSSEDAKIWKGFIIAILVITDLVNIIGLLGAIKEHYILTIVYGVILMTYAVFAAYVDYTRGSYSSWLVSFGVALLAFVYAHLIRVEILNPTVYSSPSNNNA